MIKIFPNLEELNNYAAEKFVEIADQANSERGDFKVALAGGSTPKSLYRLLASDKFRDKVDWSKVFFFFGDERNVPPNDPQSNFRMADENLFEPLKISTDNIFRWKTEEKSVEVVAEDYESRVRDFFDKKGLLIENPGAEPSFDLILLGMGTDGHTASLFPFTKALTETGKIAVADRVEKLGTTRLTFTFPVINSARNVIFLVAGEEKAETLQKVLEGEFQPEKFPAQSVAPPRGELFWLIDEKAASKLTNR